MAPTFESVFERGNYSFIWLTSFKIVLLCCDDDPVADPWAVASFPRFLAVMPLSLQIKRKSFEKKFQRIVMYAELMKKQHRASTVGTDVIAEGRKAIACATKRTSLDPHLHTATTELADQLVTSPLLDILHQLVGRCG